jgi:hypothetical protein
MRSNFVDGVFLLQVFWNKGDGDDAEGEEAEQDQGGDPRGSQVAQALCKNSAPSQCRVGTAPTRLMV